MLIELRSGFLTVARVTAPGFRLLNAGLALIGVFVKSLGKLLLSARWAGMAIYAAPKEIPRCSCLAVDVARWEFRPLQHLPAHGAALKTPCSKALRAELRVDCEAATITEMCATSLAHFTPLTPSVEFAPQVSS